jgi:DNA helicase-2/ATP-dependent DNA helicase PcrA
VAHAPFLPTPEQSDVIAYRGGHLQVVACAGAGKTEEISRRVSTLIEEGVEPSQIVAFIFTERAAEGLKARITKRVSEAKGQEYLDRLGPMFVGTIHAYCLIQKPADAFRFVEWGDPPPPSGASSRP